MARQGGNHDRKGIPGRSSLGRPGFLRGGKKIKVCKNNKTVL